MRTVSPACRFLLGVALGCLVACSRPAGEPPRGLAGLAFGAAPTPDLVSVPVVLPAALAGILRYCTRPGPAAPFWGAAVSDPVFGFYREQLFSVRARLADPAAAPGLARRLTAAFGPPLCRERAGRRFCLWQPADVDVSLEQDGETSAWLLVRHRGLAAPVLSWRDGAGPNPGGEDAP